MTDDAPSPAPQRRRRRNAVAALAGLGIGLAALWSGAWFFASRLAHDSLSQWIEAEAAHGRQWTCPDTRVTGFPLAVVLHCRQPTFQGELSGHPAQGHIEGLRASVAIGHPRTVRVSLRGPFYLRGTDDSFDLVASWTTMVVRLAGVPGPLTGADLEGTRFAVTLAVPDKANLNLRAADLAGAVSPTAEDTDKAFTFDLTGVALPTVEGIPELQGPADLTGAGVLAQATLLDAPTVRRLEAWRLAGGLLRLDRLTVQQGGLSGRLSGTLALDEEHRPAGKLDASVKGFEPLAKWFGIPVAGVQLGGLLSTLLGGSKPHEREPGAVSLPLVLQDGRLSVGPVATALRLDPLY